MAKVFSRYSSDTFSRTSFKNKKILLGLEETIIVASFFRESKPGKCKL